MNEVVRKLKALKCQQKFESFIDKQGCDKCIFFWMHQFLSSLDRNDILCSVYLNFCVNEIETKVQKGLFLNLRLFSFAICIEIWINKI